MFCAISGKPPRTPVVSLVSKCVFEKDLIEQYIQETGNDPISNAPLSVDQLLIISQTPQQSAFTNAVNSSTLNSNYSIPNLLSSLQNEWDAIMLENFRLRKQLDAFTKQLSTALYERDAAKIVASNALREREQLVQELNQLSLHLGVDEAEESEEQVTGLPQDLIEQLLNASKEYVNITKKNKDLFVDEVSELVCRNNYNASDSPVLQSGSKLRSGLSKSVVFTIDDGNTVYYTQGDKNSQFEINVEEKLEYLTMTPNEEYLIFSTTDGKIGTYNIKESQKHVLEIRTDEIILIQSHEYILNDQFLWVDKKGKVGYSSLDGSKTTLVSQGGAGDFSRAALHKDGLLLALVQDDNIQIRNVTQFEEPPTVWNLGKEINQEGSITGVKFSSNGYWMIVSTTHAIMSFDLRKSVGTLAVQPITIESQIWDTDLSGKHLVIWQSGRLQFYSFVKSSKTWELNKDLPLKPLEEQDLKSLKLSYGESGAVTVLQSLNKIQVFSLE
ncbi:ZYRO0G07898p [Zygosaccharomyces rouxii]|uniref:Pre-mRNA-processing factor 19 n=1 Tax=Zygosaccharomyces rouxii (strain ATCC 2623 / CBS 732 / NBRC 1130 / NCYC 568 / NRRL Y-229) TaxID=559307 RepID=C5DZX1_ZYGRC|nr:uncharacterized protein ZYRO0G07898g [Zygosaccharomyces rouxii]KAH9202401.1 Prp19/Pso4-like-domain-containing protein [Zygosaccharomyces rouxii]CAR29405.1 ZYRO0G07898p [Zygosaccharomyces rouxii]